MGATTFSTCWRVHSSIKCAPSPGKVTTDSYRHTITYTRATERRLWRMGPERIRNVGLFGPRRCRQDRRGRGTAVQCRQDHPHRHCRGRQHGDGPRTRGDRPPELPRARNRVLRAQRVPGQPDRYTRVCGFRGRRARRAACGRSGHLRGLRGGRCGSADRDPLGGSPPGGYRQGGVREQAGPGPSLLSRGPSTS